MSIRLDLPHTYDKEGLTLLGKPGYEDMREALEVRLKSLGL